MTVADYILSFVIAVAVAVVVVAITVGVIKNNNNYHEERMQLREIRAQIVETCQSELDTDMQECVETNMKLIDEGTSGKG